VWNLVYTGNSIIGIIWDRDRSRLYVTLYNA
jgi:hypothetical protein